MSEEDIVAQNKKAVLIAIIVFIAINAVSQLNKIRTQIDRSAICDAG